MGSGGLGAESAVRRRLCGSWCRGGSPTVAGAVLLSRLHQGRHHRQELRAADPVTPARDEVHDVLDRNDVGLPEAYGGARDGALRGDDDGLDPLVDAGLQEELADLPRGRPCLPQHVLGRLPVVVKVPSAAVEPALPGFRLEREDARGTDDDVIHVPVPGPDAMEDPGALDLKELSAIMACPVIVDLRNIYSPEEVERNGFLYCGVGRPKSVAY